MPVHALTDRVQIPTTPVSPGRRITTRVIYALAALFAAVVIVYLDRHGYRDIDSPQRDDPLSFLDCLYYATVSLSTTGYGDITPVTPSARLDQRPGHHPAAGRVPDRADRHHRRDAHHAVATGLPDPAMEEQIA